LDEGIVGFAIKQIEDNLERVRDHPDYGRFRSEADEIISRIKRTGSSSASILFIMGEKLTAYAPDAQAPIPPSHRA
jgi:hypothetical protein